MRCSSRIIICLSRGRLPWRWRPCIYPSRFGCGSSRSMAMVIPLMNSRRESAGATAQGRHGEPGLGKPGEPDGGGRWPPPKCLTERARGSLRSLTVRRTGGGRQVQPPSRGGPKQGPRSRQRQKAGGRMRESRRQACGRGGPGCSSLRPGPLHVYPGLPLCPFARSRLHPA